MRFVCRGASSSAAARLPLVLAGAQLEIERKLRTLLVKEREKAEEQAALAMGLCTGGSMLP